MLLRILIIFLTILVVNNVRAESVNTHISTTLFIDISKSQDGTYFISNINNNKGMINLETLQPTFDTRTVDCGAKGIGLKEQEELCPDKIFFNKGVDAAATAKVYAKTLGLAGLFTGFTGRKISSVFDKDEYDKAIKMAVPENDRNRIIKKYIELQEYLVKLESDRQPKKNALNQGYSDIYDKYVPVYQGKYRNAIMKLKVTDYSGFYDHSIDPGSLISLNKNNFYWKPLEFGTAYTISINTSFTNYDDTISKIKTEIQSRYDNYDNKYKNELAMYEKFMHDTTSSFQVSLNNISKINDFNINVSAPISVSISNTSAPEIPIMLTVLSKDFQNVYPKNTIVSDKNIDINFDGNSIAIKNKTQTFLQVMSISTYYNGEISTRNFNQNEFIELPPESVKKDLPFVRTSNIDYKSSFQGLTASIAKKSKVNFGFAIKYRVVEQSIDRTLYKTYDYNLYSLISKL